MENRIQPLLGEDRPSGDSVLGWNTRSVAKRSFEQFIAALNQELSLGTFARLLNGLSHVIGQICREKDTRSFSETRKNGLNRAGFLVHRNFAGSLGDFKNRGRTVALNFDWQGKKFCAMASHLHPYHDLEEYRKDLNDV